ncbi:MAG TPA: hypothetical protein VKE41_16355 [Roseiflexaceae bacterium]|nr:hypothetical protein [Roseiflexaceae bacterium]
MIGETAGSATPARGGLSSESTTGAADHGGVAQHLGCGVDIRRRDQQV